MGSVLDSLGSIVYEEDLRFSIKKFAFILVVRMYKDKFVSWSLVEIFSGWMP